MKQPSPRKSFVPALGSLPVHLHSFHSASPPGRRLISLVHQVSLAFLILFSLSFSVGAQVTNWIAFNDHSPSTSTAPNVSPYNLRGVGLSNVTTTLLPRSGRLTNFAAGSLPVGQALPAGIIVTAANSPVLFPGAGMASPFPDTPAMALFGGIVDLANADSAIGLSAGEQDTVILTFTNLNPSMHYTFYGTAVRNGPTPNVHPGRWTISSIVGATAFATAHTAGVLTQGTPGLSLTNGQGVFQSGINTNGEMVGWTQIQPAPNGTFSIESRGYSGPVTGGTFGALLTNAFDNIGYALSGIMLAEYGPLTAVSITTQPQSSVTLTQGQRLALFVKATGSAPQFQWYKTGAGLITGATDSFLTMPGTAVSDSGSYYVVVSNSVNVLTSQVAAVTVIGDSVAPFVTGIFPSADHTQITVEFSEPITVDSSESFNFEVHGVNAPGVSLGLPGPNPSTVILTLDSGNPMQDDTAYTLFLASITDLAGNSSAGGIELAFRSRTSVGMNGLLFEAFRPIGGNPITNLTTSPLFPNFPAEQLRMTRFDTTEVYPDTTHESFGGRIRGLFIPPVSGGFKFYLRSDDSSELYINPNGPSAFGKVRVAQEIGCCNAFIEDSPGWLASGSIPMRAGQAYYIEALYKEGGGGDYCQVTAKLDSDPTFPGVVPSIPATYLGFPAVPAGIGGGIQITRSLTNLTVFENASYVLSVQATNTNGLPVSYRWKRDGLYIENASSQSYTGTLATVVDDGAEFTVELSTIGTTVETAPATLTVIADTTGPEIVSVTHSEIPDRLVVVFSETVSSFNAIDPLAYEVMLGQNAVFVDQATLSNDGRTVVLRLAAPLAAGTAYTVSAPGVTDVAFNPVAGAPVAFTSLSISPGFLNFAVYDTQDANGGNGANAVSILTSHPSFPMSPREKYFLKSFDTRDVYPTDSHDAYGGRLAGVFIPPTSGNWTFYLRSDDSSELYLNPAGVDPNGKTLLTAETGCCNPFSAHASAPQALTAGAPVYIEALYKEGVGGDFCQVAAKHESDPTPVELLQPIPGIFLGAYVQASGASLAITSQPDDQTARVITGIEPTGLISFGAGNGGFRVANVASPGGPWSYSPVTGSWACFDQGGCTTAPRSSRLTSPVLTVANSGPVIVTFVHRYSFEDDGSTRWDGAQLRVSVNRGVYAPVPLASFTAGGYNGTVGGSATPNNELLGQDAFTGESSGYGSPGYVTSTASLGTFAAGDLVSIQFLAAWDDCSEGNRPNWEIKSVEFAPTVENREADTAASFTVGAVATVTSMTNPPVSYQWQRLLSGAFADIPGATLSSYSFIPTIDEDGVLLRCILRSPGDGDTSEDAVVRVAPQLSIGASTQAGFTTLVWPALQGFGLEATNALRPPSLAPWPPVTQSPVISDGRATLTVPSGAGTLFFRLKK